jgi:hypothetical protein
MINLSIANNTLFDGCNVEMIAGRANLTTPVSEAVNIVGGNVEKLMSELPQDSWDEVVLTGPSPVWAYLVVFHAVVHRFRKVYYDDGRNGKVLIAAHG